MKQRSAGFCAWIGLCSLLSAESAVRAQTVTDLAVELAAANELGPLGLHQGTALAISADGTRALVGVPIGVGNSLSSGSRAAYRGTVLVYARTGETWIEEARLTLEGEDASPAFGAGLALSADGSVALIGATSPAGGAAHVFVRDGSSWSEQAVLSPAAGQPADLFGFAVALSADGRVALIGAANADTAAGEHAGRAYVFGENTGTWSEQAVLEATDAHALEAFGGAVALSADGATALIGAPNTETEAGAVGSARVFTRDGEGWDQSAMLVAIDGVEPAQFGWSVALSADGAIALIGARNDPSVAIPDSPGGGSARVFVRAGELWSEEAALRGIAQLAELGTSVALSADGQRALIGGPRERHPDAPRLDMGVARVFDRVAGEWIEQLAYRDEDGEAGDHLGFSVALSGDGRLALVGVPDVAIDVDGQGAVHALADDGAGLELQEVLSVAPEWHEEELGFAVALTPDGTRALVGAPGTHIDGADERGQARVFVRDGATWSLEARLRASDGEAGDRFGHAVALSADGATALIGLPGFDTAGREDSGIVRVFTRSGAAWVESGQLVAPVLYPGMAFGSAVALSADGQRAVIGTPGPTKGPTALRGQAYTFARTEAGFMQREMLSVGRDEVLMMGAAVAIDATGSRLVVQMYDVVTEQLVPRVYVGWSLEAKLEPSPLSANVLPVLISADGDRVLADKRIYSRAGNVWTDQPLSAFGLALSPDGNAAIAGGGSRVESLYDPLFCARGASAWSCRLLAGGLGSITGAALAEGASRVLLANAAYPVHTGAVRILRLEYTVDPCEDDCDDGGAALDAAIPDASSPDAAIVDDGGALADASDLDSGGDGDSSTGPEADASDPPDPMAGAGGGETDGCVVEQPAPPRDDAGCSCRIERARGVSAPGALSASLLLLLFARRARRRAARAR